MSELMISQQTALLALTLWEKGYRSHFELQAAIGKPLFCCGSADDCLQDYQWICRMHGDNIADFRLISRGLGGSPPAIYRLEFDINYNHEKGFHLHTLNVYSKADRLHEQQLRDTRDLPHINELLSALDRRKRIVSPPKKGKHL
ncbi:hypothetical protein [Chitinophaga sp. S165]|uniref:hypothetical protein n=1 Tax=Chitinophaga sp. S165 TaxID=2135462 RepID=UPI000D71C100|nr:hypothetical protein [Chitinophaga sp. S165]PWV47130.1 hypothetical protein C7475_109218 [Chitinophaga sp. S165]